MSSGRRGSQRGAKSAKPVAAAEASPSDSGHSKRPHSSYNAPSVQSILNDSLTKLSMQYWAPGSSTKSDFDAKIIETIYNEEIAGQTSSSSRIMLLELSFYLENYLWPNYKPKESSFAHLMSMMVMINEKFRENVQAWECFKSDKSRFNQFFVEILNLFDNNKMSLKERTIGIIFLINIFQSISHEVIQPLAPRLVSLPTWINLIEAKRAAIFEKHPKLQKTWTGIQKLYQSVQSDNQTSQQEATKGKKKQKQQESKSDGLYAPGSPIPIDYEQNFMFNLIQDYLMRLSTVSKDSKVDLALIRYFERFLEFMIDLLTQLTTRRFFHSLFESMHFIVLSKSSDLCQMEEGKLFKQLLAILSFYEKFEINDFTGQLLTDADMSSIHYENVQRAQSLAFKHYQPELKRFSLLNVASIDSRASLLKFLEPLPTETIRDFCERLFIVEKKDAKDQKVELSRNHLIDIFIHHLERRQSQIDNINSKSLYPDEKLLWDTNAVPESSYSGEVPLALPKLNLQFLTFHDHLLRNFTLFRLESAYEIREDIEDAVKRMQPRYTMAGTTVLRGWARMALPIGSLNITHVGKKKIGEPYPEKVVAEVSYSLPLKGDSIRGEWDALKQHDIVFLISVKAQIPDRTTGLKLNLDEKKDFPSQYGVVLVRGAEVIEVLDEHGNVISDTDIDLAPSKDKTRARTGGVARTLKLNLDCAQYHHDLNNNPSGFNEMYKSFNIIVRRSSKENNFKAILETIRDLMNTNFVVPQWLTDVFLGYGNPSASTNVEPAKEIDFVDTFLSYEHLKTSFPENEVVLSNAEEIASNATQERHLFKTKMDDGKIIATAYKKPKQLGTIPKTQSENQNSIKQNPIHFTPTQVKAIQNSMNKGLNLVVGPPGTGKTDVAVQIISNWYHNFPNQRTLLVTHSNNALNQIFEKIMVLDVDERHLLRLGHGGGMLETEKDFSKIGRVNFMLQRRLDLLSQVEQLALSLDRPADVGYSVETSINFFNYFVKAKWEKFIHQYLLFKQSQSNLPNGSTSSTGTQKDPASYLAETFPFTKFFTDRLPKPLFQSNNEEENLQFANQLFAEIQALFSELEECRAFEIMRSSYDRGNYLLTKQAKIVAMTCTHAALKRADLVKLGFKFDNILMEEAAQILEIETFIPMLLQQQSSSDATPRLKRVVLIGDHHQLPPVVKNMAFQKYAHLDQSLFTRFVKLGVPTITLDAQGRSRPSIASLYAWRYSQLSNLTHVLSRPEFTLANPGFAHEFQFINVDDYQGVGEMEPNAHFFQNLGEAEFVVATFMYMRMLGYPKEKISIITSYNGQKHLIRDVIKQRCAWDPRFGTPHKITTVDRFQGQQNDYILLSMVRTKTVGHIRDVRRLVVAMSRARLGLYVFGRKDLFKDCYELTPTFSKLLQRPQKLILLQGEQYGNMSRKIEDEIKEESKLEVADVIHMGQVVLPSYSQQPTIGEPQQDNDEGDDAASESSDDIAPYEDNELEEDEKMEVDNQEEQEKK